MTMLIKDGAYLVWIAVMTTVIKDDDDDGFYLLVLSPGLAAYSFFSLFDWTHLVSVQF